MPIDSVIHRVLFDTESEDVFLSVAVLPYRGELEKLRTPDPRIYEVLDGVKYNFARISDSDPDKHLQDLLLLLASPYGHRPFDSGDFLYAGEVFPFAEDLAAKVSQSPKAESAFRIANAIAQENYLVLPQSPDVESLALKAIIAGGSLAAPMVILAAGVFQALAMIILAATAIVVIQGAEGLGRGIKEELYKKMTGRDWPENPST